MKAVFFDCGTRDLTASAGLLALRVMTGAMMLIGHGIPKIQAYGTLSKSFRFPDIFPLGLMSPQVGLLATITAEVGASLLIMLGIATRPAAFLLAFTMVVAAFGAHQSSPWFVKPPDVLVAKELALMYLIPMIVLILSGAGAFSVDATYRPVKRRRW